ncbi:MAG: nitroreductase family protein, partial [Clostridia bacterium]|nr:nitroreductase family protein [Clostridia bacterium]
MNEIIDALHARKSVRAFEERDILAPEREAILLAAMAAPTAGNMQLYTIL